MTAAAHPLPFPAGRPSGYHPGATVNPKIHEGTWLAQPYIEGHYNPGAGVTIEGGHIALSVGPGVGATECDKTQTGR